MSFSEILQLPMTYLVDPGQRVFFLYWIFAALIAGLALHVQKKVGLKGAVATLLDSRVWSHPSARLDFQLLVFNTLFKSLLFGGSLFSALIVAKTTVRFLTLYLGTPSFSLSSSFWMVGIYTLVNFVFLDLARFLQHLLFHKVPCLWNFHKIHHSAEVLNPVTLYRTHPLESLISALRQTLVIGAISGVFIYVSQGWINIWTIMGVNALDFLFNFAASNLRHSHIWLSFGPLNRIFVSPAHHQVHHSRAARHIDKNLGFSLSVWDQLFGTYYEVREKEFLRFGVMGERNHRFFYNLWAPISLMRKEHPFRGTLKTPKEVADSSLSESFQVVIR